MSNLTQDVRYAIRTLTKSPVFCFVAVASLALGIGANTAIFSLINQLLLRLLPVKDPQELVLLTSRGSHYGSNTGQNAMSYLMYTDIRDRNQVFSGMFCRYGQSLSFSSEGKTRKSLGRTGVRKLFSSPGRQRRAGPRLYHQRRSLSRRAPFRGPELRVLAVALRRRSRRAGEKDSGEWLSTHCHRSK